MAYKKIKPIMKRICISLCVLLVFATEAHCQPVGADAARIEALEKENARLFSMVKDMRTENRRLRMTGQTEKSVMPTPVALWLMAFALAAGALAGNQFFHYKQSQ